MTAPVERSTHMKIAFIYTETDQWALGIRSVSAYLKRAGHTTRLLLTGPNDETFENLPFTVTPAEAGPGLGQAPGSRRRPGGSREPSS